MLVVPHTREAAPNPASPSLPQTLRMNAHRSPTGSRRERVSIHVTTPTTTANDNENAPAFIERALSGRLGAGRTFIADHAAQDLIDAHGPWCLVDNGRGLAYVRNTRRALRHLADQPSGSGLVSLSRLIAAAKRREVVCFRNGNRLDLRAANLLVMTRAQATKWKREQAAAHAA